MSARRPSRDRFTLARIRLAKLSTLQLVSVLSVFLGDKLLSTFFKSFLFQKVLVGKISLAKIVNY